MKDFIREAIQRKLLAYQHLLLERPELGGSPEQLTRAVEYKRTFAQFFVFFDELIDRRMKAVKTGNARTHKILGVL